MILASATAGSMSPLCPAARRRVERLVPSAVITHIRFYRIERPEIVYWEFEQYAQVIQAARATEPAWYAAALLTSSCELRDSDAQMRHHRARRAVQGVQDVPQFCVHRV